MSVIGSIAARRLWAVMSRPAARDCGHQRIAYNSCRNRHRPKCQGAAARTWPAEREADLLPVGYFHVAFSIPAELADIAFHNKAVIDDLLFRAASETMLTIAADRRHLGARIGITAVLHTWGSTMIHHPHVHMIVPGGGISLDGSRWVSSRRPFCCRSVSCLSKLFRRLFLTRPGLNFIPPDNFAFFGDHARLREQNAFLAFHRTSVEEELGGLRKATIWRATEGGARLSVALHAHRVAILKPPADLPRRTRRHFPL